MQVNPRGLVSICQCICRFRNRAFYSLYSETYSKDNFLLLWICSKEKAQAPMPDLRCRLNPDLPLSLVASTSLCGNDPFQWISCPTCHLVTSSMTAYHQVASCCDACHVKSVTSSRDTLPFFSLIGEDRCGQLSTLSRVRGIKRVIPESACALTYSDRPIKTDVHYWWWCELLILIDVIPIVRLMIDVDALYYVDIGCIV